MIPILTRKYHPALWQRGPNGNYMMTDLYSEIFHQYLTGELSQERFMTRADELQAIFDGQMAPF
jgi:hypothetical protein